MCAWDGRAARNGAPPRRLGRETLAQLLAQRVAVIGDNFSAFDALQHDALPPRAAGSLGQTRVRKAAANGTSALAHARTSAV